MSKKKPVEEFIQTKYGFEIVTKQWPSVYHCAEDLGYNIKTIQSHLYTGVGIPTGLGLIKLRFIKEMTQTMTFGEALEAVKLGRKASRKGWNGKEQYIELAMCISYKNSDGKIVNSSHKDIGNDAIAFVGTRGVQLGWLASQADMLANDWEVVK